MISIYTHTHNPFKKEFWKYVAKKILKKYSGPDAVLDSITRGLVELGIPFEVNPIKPKYKIIHVLAGVEILKERIQKKKNSETLIVGPTMVIIPTEFDKIIAHQNIDIILTPSDWVTEFYLSLIPQIKNKLFSWPSGVSIPKEHTSDRKKVIIFKKDIDEHIFTQVVSSLKKKNIQFQILEYGKFKHSEYLNILSQAAYMIYLQKSESQGIALQEAWSYGVPTLVYKNTMWSYRGLTWENEKISAPYLTQDCGLFFTLEDFDTIISSMDISKFNPRAYCEENLSDVKSVEKLINIIQHHEKTH